MSTYDLIVLVHVDPTHELPQTGRTPYGRTYRNDDVLRSNQRTQGQVREVRACVEDDVVVVVLHWS